MTRVLGGSGVPGSGRERLEEGAILGAKVESERNPYASALNVSVSDSAGWVHDKKESRPWRLALG